MCALSTWAQPALAEGSRDMFPSGAQGNRGHMEWQNTVFSAGFRRRTLLRVFANQGEYILLGSSATGVSQGDIEVFHPGTLTGNVANENIPTTANFSCRTAQPGAGFIASRSQELAGSTSIDGTGNTSGYTPCYYQAPTTGMYSIAMYGPSGKNGTANPNNGIEHNIENINTSPNQNTSISAWDVTVRGDQSSTTDLEGRLHTFHLAFNMGQNGAYLYSEIYPVTVDGFRYRIDLHGLDPFGFSIFGNQLGNLDSDGQTPLYHDVLGSGFAINNPVGGTLSASPQYPIFFNEIDPVALPFLPIYDPLSGIQTGTGFPSAAILPNVTNPGFLGNIIDSTSSVGGGGEFSFESNLMSGTYQIIISQDGLDFDPELPQNRLLRGFMDSTGVQMITWDGLDNSGQLYPPGTFAYTIKINGGEYHFPISDVENNPFGGPIYHLLNATNPLGNTVGFYDHRGYYTIDGTLVADGDPGDGDPTDDALCGINPPSPAAASLITGADSAAPGFNVFGQVSGGNTNVPCTGSFGDTKTLDIWTYFPSTPGDSNLLVIAPAEAIAPQVRLVKRITAINRGGLNEQLFDTTFVDVDTTDDDNATNWPGQPITATVGVGTLESYLPGLVSTSRSGITVKPGDRIEYTISFLSDGLMTAKDVLICDRIPTNTTFLPNAYASTSADPLSSQPNPLGIALDFNGNTYALTGDNDGDSGYYFPAGAEPAAQFPNINCGGSNDGSNDGSNENGTLVIKIDNLPAATSTGAPLNAYGALRFQVVVN